MKLQIKENLQEKRYEQTRKGELELLLFDSLFNFNFK